MPRALRSPPATSAPPKQRVMSSPDLSKIEPESEKSNITTRSKRFKPNFSPEQSSDESFENKIMNMLTQWKNEQDAILNKITTDINEVKTQNKSIQKSNIEIEKSIEFMNQAYESMKNTVERLEKERQEQRSYIMQLEKKVIDLQNNSRPSCLEIRNIPPTEKESTNDLTNYVVKTCNVLEVPVQSTDLRDVYRMPGKKGSIRPVVAEFVTVTRKNEVLNATRMFNKNRTTVEKLNTKHIGLSGESKPIYVADHLPNSLRQLFYEARKYATAHDYKFCWSYNNKIFLRKREGSAPVNVVSLDCLKNLS